MGTGRVNLTVPPSPPAGGVGLRQRPMCGVRCPLPSRPLEGRLAWLPRDSWPTEGGVPRACPLSPPSLLVESAQAWRWRPGDGPVVPGGPEDTESRMTGTHSSGRSRRGSREAAPLSLPTPSCWFLGQFGSLFLEVLTLFWPPGSLHTLLRSTSGQKGAAVLATSLPSPAPPAPLGRGGARAVGGCAR